MWSGPNWVRPRVSSLQSRWPIGHTECLCWLMSLTLGSPLRRIPGEGGASEQVAVARGRGKVVNNEISLFTWPRSERRQCCLGEPKLCAPLAQSRLSPCRVASLASQREAHRRERVFRAPLDLDHPVAVVPSSGTMTTMEKQVHFVRLVINTNFHQ